VRSSTVANQDDIHRAYGGIVPELASRNHVVTIVPGDGTRAKRRAIALSPTSEDRGHQRNPGLVGSLLVG